MENIKDYILNINEKAERRFNTGVLKFAEVETNAGKTVDENMIEGYAANFGTQSQDFGGWVETIEKNFFDGLIDDEDTYALFNHSMDMVLGRNKVNVKLSIDENGLKYSVRMPDTTLAKDLRTLVKDQIINKSSFAFTVKEEKWIKGDPSKGIPHQRVLLRGEKLYDVSPVTVPAYNSTSVAARSMAKEFRKEEALQEIRESLSAAELKLIVNINKRRKFTF